jgi:hypothetical protein
MAAMTERHEIAWAILVLALLVAAILWRRSRRVRQAPERHLRIDLVAGEGEDGGPHR